MNHLARLAARAADAIGRHATDLEWVQAGHGKPASVELSRARAMSQLAELFAVLKSTPENRTGAMAAVVEAIERRGSAICVGALDTETLRTCASLLREAASDLGWELEKAS